MVARKNPNRPAVATNSQPAIACQPVAPAIRLAHAIVAAVPAVAWVRNRNGLRASAANAVVQVITAM